MKKILILLSFLSASSFAAYTQYPDFVTMEEAICQTSTTSKNLIFASTQNSSIVFSKSMASSDVSYWEFYGSTSVGNRTTLLERIPFTDFYDKYITRIDSYICGVATCPEGQQWNSEYQKCTCKPLPNQRYNETLDACTDMCLPLDIYQGDGFMSLNILFPNDPIACKTPPIDSVPEDKCNQYSNQGYSYKCWTQDSSNMNVLQKLYYKLFPDELPPNGKHCRCSSSAKMPPLILPLGVSGKMPRISNDGKAPRLPDYSNTDPIIPELENPKLWTADDLANIFDDAEGASSSARQTEYEQYNDWLASNPDKTSGYNYDYIDTKIEPDGNGGYIFVPDFETTPTPAGTTPKITDTTFSDRVSSAPNYSSTQSHAPAGSDLASTADVYTTQYQTATKTKVQFSEPTTGNYQMTTTRPSNVSTTATEPMSVPATRTSYTTTPEGYTVTTYQAQSGDTTYTTTVTNRGDEEDTQVSTSTPVGNTYYTHRTAYSYTKSTSTGDILSSSPSSTTSTTTSPNGTTYNNTTSNPNSNYNYNTGQQNLDELLNFEPKVTDTAMKKPLEDLISKQNETLNFIDSLKNSINGIKLDFDAMMLKLQNPPTLQPKSGNCVMTAVWHGNTITANPCTAFYPYREMISLFLTIVGMFFVGKFAVENLK